MQATEKQLLQARFWRKLLRLTRGRVTILRALEIIAAEEQAPDFRPTVLAVRQALESGRTLSEALGDRPEVFSQSVRELVRTAEKTGAWEEILQEIADGLQDGTFD